MSIDSLLRRAEDLGAVLDGVVVGREVDKVPPAPSHVWVVVPRAGGGVVVGGMDRGTWAPYAAFGGDAEERAAAVLARLTVPGPPPRMPRPEDGLRAAAAAVEARLGATARPGPDLVPPGTPLDHIGSESGHFLYLYGTPMGQRSLPPTDLALARTGYLLDGPLPASATVERVPPWFGQAGGALVVRLDRVIAYHCDTGLLRRFAPPSRVSDAPR